MPDKFAFTPIDGKLELEEATEQLVHIAKCMQTTHDNLSAQGSRRMMQTIFDSRKTGITVLLDLIEQYIHQMPDPLERNNDELEVPTS